ncbi:hypothetical protein CCHOA_11730 [Corynebacterium choanae]|uniref:Uncharacterized protein n=1 Tax=Corynebacterium choanae TaxID=1862358 RepID=A0A3G6J9H2_9CORY|nr:hypothetical protein CCHOA_11730 [Corynebacterium choanae]
MFSVLFIARMPVGKVSPRFPSKVTGHSYNRKMTHRLQALNRLPPQQHILQAAPALVVVLR